MKKLKISEIPRSYLDIKKDWFGMRIKIADHCLAEKFKIMKRIFFTICGKCNIIWIFVKFVLDFNAVSFTLIFKS
jgi:hypothetical protein